MPRTGAYFGKRSSQHLRANGRVVRSHTARACSGDLVQAMEKRGGARVDWKVENSVFGETGVDRSRYASTLCVKEVAAESRACAHRAPVTARQHSWLQQSALRITSCSVSTP